MTITEKVDHLDGDTHDCGHDHSGSINPRACLNDQADRMRYERYRLETFSTWPSTANVDKDELARNGFYYIGNGTDDRVKCAFCRIILRSWDRNDVITDEHKKHAPLCSFVREPSHAGNFPLAFRRLNSNNIHHQGPRHREYSTRQIRFESFYNWPKARPTRGELADAGFFYLGQGDTVKCYYCGGMLRYWEDTDDVWEEHKKWFPLCLFVVEHDPATHPELGRHLHRTISGIAVANGYTEENVQQFRDNLTETGQTSPEEYGAFVNELDLFLQEQQGGARGTETVEPSQQRVADDRKPDEEGDRYKCKVCYQNQVEMIFYPCKHVCCCAQCSDKMSNCPICRTPIRGKLQLFFS